MYTNIVSPDLARKIKTYTGKTVVTYGEALDAIFSTYPINPEFDYVGSWMVHTPDFNVSVGERKDLPSDKAFCECCNKAFEKVFAILEERIKKADAIPWDSALGTTFRLHNKFYDKGCRTLGDVRKFLEGYLEENRKPYRPTGESGKLLVEILKRYYPGNYIETIISL